MEVVHGQPGPRIERIADRRFSHQLVADSDEIGDRQFGSELEEETGRVAQQKPVPLDRGRVHGAMSDHAGAPQTIGVFGARDVDGGLLALEVARKRQRPEASRRGVAQPIAVSERGEQIAGGVDVAPEGAADALVRAVHAGSVQRAPAEPCIAPGAHGERRIEVTKRIHRPRVLVSRSPRR
ncbi:hypothetical protein FJ656_04545 [Schumannella luteola]|nr:hypothetical protein FJ656_04545 [Schumannella luteola]